MAELIGTYLERFDDRLSATAATGSREALELIDETEFDCIVSDYDMPGSDGLQLLEAVRADSPDLPFILFTGRGSEEIASDAISRGVTDYMQKESETEQYQVLAQRISNTVRQHRLSQVATTARENAETILEASPNAIFVTTDGRCVYANPTALDLVSSVSKADVLGSPISTFLHHDHDRDVFRDAQRGDALEQERLSVRDDGEETPVEATTREITWDGNPAVVYILRDITDRIAYEQELGYRQSLLRSTFEASPDGILFTDTERKIMTYNDQFFELWGIPEEVLESGDRKLALEIALDRVADGDAFRQYIESQYQNPEESQHNQVRLRDGTIVDQYSTFALAEDETPLGVVWFYRDITEVKRLEQTQQEAFDRMTDAVYAVDENWDFTFLNERAGRLLRRDTDDLLGENVWTEFPEAVDTDIYDRYHEAVEGNEPVSFELYYDPLETEFEIRAFPSETGLTVYFRDITEQRQTQTELMQSVETLHELYETASDPEMSFEEKQRELLQVGSEYLDLPYGFVTEIAESTQTVVASTGTHELLQPGESCPLDDAYCRRTISTESGLLAVQNSGAEGWSGDPAHERFELETYIGGKIVVEGELYGTVCFASSEPREGGFSEMEWTFVELLSRWLAYELEQREHQSQLEAKNAQLEEFASIVSHDLRNPLSVADGYLELAMEEDDTEHLSKVERAHDRMKGLIDDILTLAREGEIVNEPTRVDLRTLIEGCWENVDTEDARLVVDAEGTVVADESRSAQLLENLVRNAVEHGGRTVTVTVGDLPDGFYLEDDGSGIPEDVRSKLFQPGFSTKEGGTGIGLRVADQIATAHGWDIAATASSTGGARFEITGVERPSETVV
ncbi:PAS domain S-box protein [Halopelagius inordinatus]